METNRSNGPQQNQTPSGTTISNQLAEYRKRQEERYKQQNKSEDQDNSLNNVSRDAREQSSNQVFPEMVRLPNSQQPINQNPQPESKYDLDYELAKRLQEEELLESERNLDNQNQNLYDQPYPQNIPNYGDGIRPADSYRAEQLIPDANEEALRRQEFIRQQQILYSQYQGGNRQFNANDMERNFNGADAPLLRRRSVHHLQLPVVGRVNREVCNWICLGFLFSILITTMILVLIFAK